MESNATQDCLLFDSTAWLLISGEIDREARTSWEKHLVGCTRCAALICTRRHLLDLYDGLAPSVDSGVDLSRIGRDARRSAWWRPSAPALAAGLVMTLLGSLVGFFGARHGEEPGTLRSIQRRLGELEVRLAVAGIDRPTAAERLKATRASIAMVDRDPRVVDSLVEVLASDPSPNVRMAAIDALYRAARLAPLQARLGELLGAQDSPILRIALIELAADRGLTASLAALKREAAESRDAAVRERARWAIAELTRGT